MLSWHARIEPKSPPARPASDYDARAERAANKLHRLGIRGLGFEAKLTKVERRLAADDAKQFELGLEELGELLGLEVERSTATAAPDAAWRDDTRLWLLFEAKTEERAENPVSTSEARQAASHFDWVKGQLGWDEPDQSLTALVTYKKEVDAAAAAVARDVVLVDPAVIRAIGARAIGVYRELRPRSRALSDEQLAAAITDEFRRRHLRSEDLISELSERRVAEG